MRPSRRSVLAAAAGLPFAQRAQAQDMPRVAALGWAAGQTLLALGVTPLALPEIDRYRRLVVEPAVPAGVRELGLRSEPNLELLKALSPDFLVSEGAGDSAGPMTDRIAPVASFAPLRSGSRPADVARAATTALATRLGRPRRPPRCRRSMPACSTRREIGWLDILPLGEATARAMGVSVTKARLAVMLCTAALTATATLVVGPLSFVGLMAPHMARLIGLHRGLHQLIGAVLLGGAVMTLADWCGRTWIYPYQLPADLVATLLGGPYLMWLLRRR